MQPTSHREETLRFDVYELNLRAGELRKSDHKIRLQEQPFRILAILLQRPGEVVTREELREQLWPADTFVDFDHSLNTAIKKLRQALNDEAVKPRYIETLPKRGYRFVGPAVESLSARQPSSVTDRDADRPTAAAHPIVESPAASAEAKATTLRSRAVASFALLAAALGAAAFFFFHRPPALTEKDTLVLADFANSTGDAVFDDTLKRGLAVQLGQSPFLSILSDEKVRDTLKLMGRAPSDRITPEVARDLCQRAGSKVYLGGSIASLGSQYVLGLSAVNCRTGDSIAQQQVQAARKEDVLKALGEASKELRKKLGESLGSVQQFDTPIVQATTPSLEALKAYSLGIKTSAEQGEVPAIPFFKRAIELDPSFALAYATLGTTYFALGEPGLAAENLRKAYELRERVSDREKFEITANFYTGVTGELEKANQTCEIWARAYSRDHRPHMLLAYNYELLGRYEKAISENLEALRLNPDIAVIYSNLMEDYTPVNRLEEAKATYHRALDRKLDGPYLHTDLYVIAFLENDNVEMQRQISLASGTPGAEDWLFSLQSDTSAFGGQLGKAREFSRRAVESARRNDLKEVAAIWQMNAAVREVEFGNMKQARLGVEGGLKLAPTRDSQILAALVLARAGDTLRAQAMADDLAKHFPANSQLNSYWLPSIRAAIELDRGHPAEAIKILEPATYSEIGYPDPMLEGGSLILPAYLRGQAYLLLHQGKEAAGEFQKFLDYRAAVVNCPLGALAHLWLGRAYASQGDNVKSRAAYQDFFTLWEDADPDIPILRVAKSEYGKLP
ncbi:MAG: winged helix-turn-helix domain-containing protein [Candidatus Acidiferrales bacterium]